MSLSSSEMINKKMFHHRRASKELEVFEAARYFSDYNETSATMNGFGTKFTPKVKKKDKGWIKGRISLDMQVFDLNIEVRVALLKFERKFNHVFFSDIGEEHP